MHEKQYLTLKEVAARLSVTPDTVRAYVKSGQLRGVLVSSDPETPRPRYVVELAELEAFERRRRTGVEPKRTGRRASVGAVTEYV